MVALLLQERKRERRTGEEVGCQGCTWREKSKLTRDRDRDISEKIALGQANVGATGQPMYDQRLFNQDTGVASGLGPDDTYNVYDKALFADKGSGLYRPNKQWMMMKSLWTLTRMVASSSLTRASAVLTMEQHQEGTLALCSLSGKLRKQIPLAWTSLLTMCVAMCGRRMPLDSIGGGGAMRAGGGGGKYEDYAGGSSRSQVQFERSRH